VPPTLSVLIVTWNSREELVRTLPAVMGELEQGDELIVVDNGSEDDTAEVVAELAPGARFVANGRNEGFPAACNAAGALAANDLLVFLNPDAAPMAGWGPAIRRPLSESRGWAAWQSLVADHGGERINSAGNPVHFTGLVWAGSHGRPISAAPPAGEVPALSGACFAIPRSHWQAAGGFPEDFFLYHEDVDLSLRLRLGGGRLGIEPAAVVDHEYEFGSRQHKWRMLERNRWAFLIRVYPAPLLALVFPALLATELALVPASVAAGWGRQKAGALLDVARWLPRLLRERRLVQSFRRIDASTFAAHLTAELDSPFIPQAARSAPAQLALRAYWRAVRVLLGLRSTDRSGEPGSR
jgi:GT2 family glycosyltransferase